MLELAGILAIVIGLIMGTLGGGGAVLSVPMLTYLFELEPKVAIATSLLVVASTSVVATVGHARRGNVDWSTAGLFGVAAMVGGYVGGRLGVYFSGPVLLILFGILMTVSALGMLKGSSKERYAHLEPGKRSAVWVIFLQGLLVGGAAGLVGAGGGFLIVPCLVLLGGMPIHRAVGTALVVIALQSFAAYLGHAKHVTIDWAMASVVMGGAAVGAVLGVKLAPRVPAARLRTAFGIFVLMMALLILSRELGGEVSTWLGDSAVWVVGTVIGLSGTFLGLRVWSSRRAPATPPVNG
ncbi:MAG: sulfite exporter TauE/SafE family protein [Myxococcota bacterium]|nr:sulfite exporter TauE/SafE family protein [Myxococcota bacterium]